MNRYKVGCILIGKEKNKRQESNVFIDLGYCTDDFIKNFRLDTVFNFRKQLEKEIRIKMTTCTYVRIYFTEIVKIWGTDEVIDFKEGENYEMDYDYETKIFGRIQKTKIISDNQDRLYQ